MGNTDLTQQNKDNTELLLDPLTRRSSNYYLLVCVLLAIIAWGAYAYFVQLTNGVGVMGTRSEVMWGVYTVDFVFFIGISHVGALMSAILRLTSADWRKPITRLAEVVTFASLIVAVMFPIVHLGRPDRLLTLFVTPKLQSPLIWDTICIATYMIGSTIFLYLPLIPDIATCRDRLSNVSSFRRRIYSALSLGWTGSEPELQYLEKAIGIMTLLIIPIAISVHTAVSWDFAMQLRTGWDSSIFGPYFVAGALLSGVATVLLVMAALTKFYHLDSIITRKHFDNIAALLLALDIVMIYLTINEYAVPGYKYLGQTPLEGQWLSSLFWGIYWPRFWFQIIAGLILPAFIIVIPRARTVTGYLVAALLVDIGMWVERLDIIVPSLAIPQLPYAWGQYTPSWIEISITAAAFAGFTLIYLVFTRIFPIVSIWETAGTNPSHKESSTGIHLHTGNQASRSPSAPFSRRGFLSYGAIIAAGFTAGSISSVLTSSIVRSSQKSPVNIVDIVPTSILGESVSVSEAKSVAKFQVAQPTRMPMGSIVSDIRVGNKGELVAFLYANPNVPTISLYGSNVEVAVLEIADPRLNGPPTYLPNGFQRVTVNRNNGFAREPGTAGFDNRTEPGQLQWWQDSVHMVIFANLPIEELRHIAESMELI